MSSSMTSPACSYTSTLTGINSPRDAAGSAGTSGIMGRNRTAPRSTPGSSKMEKWVAWFKELGTKGHIKDPGHPLEGTGKIVKGKQKAVNDGPYAEAKDVVGGYMRIEAKDLAHAVELSEGCPILGRRICGSAPDQKLNMSMEPSGTGP
jgi:hypothetical protein